MKQQKRQAEIVRDTKETHIKLAVDLDGGAVAVDSGIGFFDHMLELLGYHSGSR